MASKRKFFQATDPDNGAVYKRASDTRTYAFCVARTSNTGYTTTSWSSMQHLAEKEARSWAGVKHIAKIAILPAIETDRKGSPLYPPAVERS